ncbi:MAG: preprotein translocase subunit SecE [Chloroflexi bacterium]|nr:preprotein translocase subunit SecE [Chloroflexota bacterium]
MSKTMAIKKGRKRFRFFRDTISELRKVVWPTRQETTRLTLVVLAVCIVVGIILFAIDYGFTELAKKVFLGGK